MLKEYLNSMRPFASCFAGLITMASFKVGTGSLCGVWKLVIAIIICSFAIMAQNDLRDRWHDAKKGKCFALEHEKSYKLFVVILWFVAIITSWWASQGNTGYAVIFGVVIFSGLIYSELHAIPLLPNLVVSLSLACPTLFSLFANSHSHCINFILFFIIATTSGFGREILKDFDDQDIDPGYKWTLLQWVGPQKSLLVVVTLLVIGTICVFMINFAIVPFLLLLVPFSPSISLINNSLKERYYTKEIISSAKTMMDIGMAIQLTIMVLIPVYCYPPEWLPVIAKYVSYSISAYLIGGIPFSWLAVWWFGKRDASGKRQDLRMLGSGNVGATNAMRQLSWKWYPVLIALDASKAILAMIIFQYLFPIPDSNGIWYGLMALIGHCFPIYLGFERGKGVSCTVGILIACGYPILLVIFCSIWLIALLVSWTLKQTLDQRVWIASIVATISVPITIWILTRNDCMTGIFLSLAAIVIIRHKDHYLKYWKWEIPSFDKYSLFDYACDRIFGKVN